MNLFHFKTYPHANNSRIHTPRMESKSISLLGAGRLAKWHVEKGVVNSYANNLGYPKC